MLTELAETYSTDIVYSVDKLLDDMDAVGIDEAVVSPFPLDNWEDSDWYISEIVDEHDRLYGIGIVDVFADDAAETLRSFMAIDGNLGFRIGTNFPGERDKQWDNDYLDPEADWLPESLSKQEDFWATAVDTGAHVQLHTSILQFDQIEELVEAYPELDYTVDHLGFLSTDLPPADEDFEEWNRLVPYDNIAVKLAGVPLLAQDEYPYESYHDYVQWFVDNLGRERVVWGSDWPNMSQLTSYEHSLQWLEEVDGLSDTDREWITERSFRNLVGI